MRFWRKKILPARGFFIGVFPYNGADIQGYGKGVVLKKSPLWKTILINLLKFGVVIGAFAFLIGSGKLKLDDLNNSLRHPGYVALGILFCFIPMLISFLRYHYLLLGVNINLGLAEVTRLGFIGCFFNTFMLGSVGGDIVKVAYIIRDTGKRAPVIASAMVDRVMGLLGVIALGGGAMLLALPQVLATPSLHKLAVAIFTVLAISLVCGLVSLVTLLRNRKWGWCCWLILAVASGAAVWALGRGIAFHPIRQPWEEIDAGVLLRSRMIVAILSSLLMGIICIIFVPSCQPGRRFERWVSRYIPLGNKVMSLAQSLLEYRNRLGVFAGSFLLSLLTHGTNLLSLFFFSRAIDLRYQPSVADIFFAAPMAYVANSLPVPGGGLGVGELAFDSLLAMCRSPEGAVITGGASIFLIWRFWYIVLGLLGLPFYLKGKKKIEEAEEEYLREEEREEEREARARQG